MSWARRQQQPPAGGPALNWRWRSPPRDLNARASDYQVLASGGRTTTPGRRRAGRRHIDDDVRACPCSWQSSIWQAAIGLSFSFRWGRWKHNATHLVPWLSPAVHGHPSALVVISRDDGGIDTAVSFQGDSMAGVARWARRNGSNGTWFSRRFIDRIGRGVEKTTCWEGRGWTKVASVRLQILIACSFFLGT
jgi:hypothetical protein